MSKASKTFSKAVKASLISLTAGATLTACSPKHNEVIQCYGVDRFNPKHPLMMTRGQCEKLDGHQVSEANAQQKQDYLKPQTKDYVECYGVAASRKNDCGTNDSACAGSEPKAKAPDAWIAFPRDLCKRVGGKVVEAKAHSTWSTHSNKAKPTTTTKK